MAEDSSPGSSHLFRMRLWVEDLGNGRSEWRGFIHHVLSDKEQFFRSWDELQHFMRVMLDDLEEETEKRPPVRRS